MGDSEQKALWKVLNLAKGVTDRISVTMCKCGYVYKVFPLLSS